MHYSFQSCMHKSPCSIFFTLMKIFQPVTLYLTWRLFSRRFCLTSSFKFPAFFWLCLSMHSMCLRRKNLFPSNNIAFKKKEQRKKKPTVISLVPLISLNLSRRNEVSYQSRMAIRIFEMSFLCVSKVRICKIKNYQLLSSTSFDGTLGSKPIFFLV